MDFVDNLSSVDLGDDVDTVVTVESVDLCILWMLRIL